jgi:hypothetical protein
MQLGEAPEPAVSLSMPSSKVATCAIDAAAGARRGSV